MGIWRQLWSRRSREIGIDLGTANTLVHVRGKGVVLNEPSVVVVDQSNGAILAVGSEAKAMLGRTPANVQAVRPLKDGVIADFDIAEAMLRYFMQRVHRRRTLVHPIVVIGIPSGVTEVECRAVRDAILRAGAREVFLIEEPMAAAIGAGLPVAEPTGSMVVDIGGGTTEVAVISLNGVVAGRSERVGGDEIDEAIVSYLHHEFNLAIGLPTAEQLKLDIGCAYPMDGNHRIAVARGRDLLTGLPKSVEVTSPQVREAIAVPVNGIEEAIRVTLEQTPAELAADIIERGIVLTGGGALLRGIDRLLAEQTQIPVQVAEDPLTCVVIGAGRALEEADKFADAFASY
ncbi:MAG: rod shape-determining protein [Armatimonadota bacterium]|nr:MAG: rod shape-determining protein [Armatimonadota bacterium]